MIKQATLGGKYSKPALSNQNDHNPFQLGSVLELLINK